MPKSNTSRGATAQPPGDEGLSPPPITADVDLRNFSYLPLDVQRLRDSDLALMCPGEAFKANTLLWCVSWHQVPAGSVPDDDRWLARHSGAGARWSKIKSDALWGFTKCSDGRWYHRVVVEKAKEAWSSKREQALRTLKARIAAIEKRLEKAKSESDAEHLKAMLNGLQGQLSQAIVRSVDATATDPVADSKGREDGREDGRERDSVPPAKLPADDVAAQAVIEVWNGAAERVNRELDRNEWPLVQKLTPDRRKVITARLKTYGLEKIKVAIERASTDPWARGEAQRKPEFANWHFDFDCLLRDKVFIKFLEKPADDGRRPAHQASGIEAFARGAMSGADKPLKGILDR